MSQQTINTPRDTTLQATNTALGLLAKDASLLATNTALGLVAKDATLEDVVTNLSTIITKLQAIATALTPSIANDYDELVDKPQINGVTLEGNKTAKQLGIRQTIPMNSAAYALLSSAEKMDPDKDYIITDANAVNVPIDDSDISTNKVWSSKKTDDTKADKEAILQTVEECSASTDPEDIAGAAALSALNSKFAYSTTAEVVIGTYDGATLYRRIYESSGTGARDFAIDSNITYGHIRSMTATLSYQSVFTSEPYFSSASDFWNYYVNFNNGHIYFRGAGSPVNQASTLTVIIEYTKAS